MNKVTSHIHTTDRRNLKASLLLMAILPVYLIYQHLAKQESTALAHIEHYAHKTATAFLRTLGLQQDQ